jgi:hypothetical protein
MGLLDDLRAAAPSLDPQFQPSSNEAGPVLGALIAYTEHADKFLKAAQEGTAAVTELLAPAPAADGSGAAAPADEGKAKGK